MTLTIGIVAGEISGDTLGGDFMAKMNALHSDIRWVGVGGASMQAQGLSSVIKMDRLSVMGLFEVARHLPDLFKAKSDILQAFSDANIDIFVGIDAPDFNLRLAKSLKNKGVFTVQYVSPSVWAWRENRIHNIIASTHLVLCLFPFETTIYEKYQHPAVCVGHPLIQTLAPSDLPKTYQLCLMGGSRVGEMTAILPILLQSLAKLFKQNQSFNAIIPLAKNEHKPLVESLIDKTTPHLSPFLTILTPQDWQNSTDYQSNYTASQYAMQASHFTLLASGTATLEALMLHAPMTVVYKVNPLTYHIAKRLLKTPYVALPNILHNHLHGSPLVPECLQNKATGDEIAKTTERLMNDSNYRLQLSQFADKLRTMNEQNPAQIVLDFYHKETKQGTK